MQGTAMNSVFSMQQNESGVVIKGRHFRFNWNRDNGKLSEISLFDGIHWQKNILVGKAGHNWELPLDKFEVLADDENSVVLLAEYKSEEWRLCCKYEVFKRGYVICDLLIKALKEGAVAEPLRVGMELDKDIFRNAHCIKNSEAAEPPLGFRAISVDFSTDSRPVTNSINFLLESVLEGMKPGGCKKESWMTDSSFFCGWLLSCGSFVCGLPYHQYPEGFEYRNRWGLAVTALNNQPNPVRGQRIYTWYGLNPIPEYMEELIDEMAEYGCSILHLHNWSKYISGSAALDEKRLKEIIAYSHKLGIKVLCYCQPCLISITAPQHKELQQCRTECLGVWNAKQQTQIVSYLPFYDWDCDELCLRTEKAYRFICDSVIESLQTYHFDGLYIDFCWPAQGLCNDTLHHHSRGLFNFYDYLRILREWRNAIGENGIMIGHGGGYLVSSDFVEAFDACLTGEAQADFLPSGIGQQFGTAPDLWTMQRGKQDEFRSHTSIAAYIREGMTPHVGTGIAGTAILATLDPAHHKELIALWQMWRGFPVEKGTFFNYLTETVVELDNDEIYYSLYKTQENQLLLLLVNAGGAKSRGGCAVGVNVKVDIERLQIPNKMRCWRMKGNTYETFRISEVGLIENGCLSVPEIGIHEFIGFVLAPNEPPPELCELQKHLAGRWKRLPMLLENKQKRQKELDRLIDEYSTLPNAGSKLDYKTFMKNRAAE